MPVYRYTGTCGGTSAPAPNAESILDALSDELLTQPDLGSALETLQRRGFPTAEGAHHPGTSDVAQTVRQAQRDMRRRYSFDSVTRDFAQELRRAVREELQAIDEHYRARADARQESVDEWQRQLAQLKEHATGAPVEGEKRLRRHAAEERYESLFLQVDQALSDARTDQQEERERLGTLEQLPMQPIDALEALEHYDCLSKDAAHRLANLRASRSEVAGLAAAEWRHAFTGDEALDATAAASVSQEMRDLDRLEAHLRGGRLRLIDPERVGEQLGMDARRTIEILQQVGTVLQDAGYVIDDGTGVRLSPRAMRRLGSRALREMFTSLKRTGFGEHETGERGPGILRSTAVRPYEAGDPFDIHVNETLLRAALRRPRVPLRLRPTDFMVHESDATVYTATVLMLDLSYTMMRDGRIQGAKKVALALDALMRTRFPKDILELIGFSTLARPLTLAELPNVVASKGQPFTNMQDGLRQAARLLRRHRGANRQIILITDGEPTAIVTDRGQVRSCYPPDEEIFEETLAAVHECTAHGIVINIIMLDQQPELVEFVRRMAHVNRGRAIYCTPETLGQYVIFDYLRGKRLAIQGS